MNLWQNRYERDTEIYSAQAARTSRSNNLVICQFENSELLLEVSNPLPL
jgi:hypothetical protein